MKPARLATLAAWPFAVAVAAVVGGIGSREAPQLYSQLSLPAWAPPASVFGPVWTALYVAMAVAAWLVARAPAPRRFALGLFGAQLLANAAWSWCFFAWRNGPLAVADVLLLWGLLVATLVAFWRVRASAGVLLLPYLAWVSFAVLLTVSAWLRNPGLL